MTSPYSPRARVRGTTLIEVLVTVVILAFGLLGIAAFQSKAQIGSIEAYQRAQAVVLLNDLQSRLSNNYAHASEYETTSPLGAGTDDEADCSGKDVGSARDLCEWNNALKGNAELVGSGDNASKIGAMVGARGCVKELVPSDPSQGVCTPGVYLVTVAWQGLHETKAPVQECANDAYGKPTLRRAISVRVVVGLPRCDPKPL